MEFPPRIHLGPVVSLIKVVGLAFLLGALDAVGQSDAPFAATQGAINNAPFEMILTGMATPNGITSVAWFEWGNSEGYSNVTTAVSVGEGTQVVRVTAPITGLSANTLYCYRLVVSNGSATTYGAPHFSTTGWRATAWGWNDYGQTTVPFDIGDVVSVAAGYYHSLALKVDGSLAVWGYTPVILPVPASATNIIQIACGGYHSVAIRSNSTVVAWGSSSNGQTNVPVGLTNVIAVSSGEYHNLALKADGKVIGWGLNSYGQATPPAGLSNVVAIAAGRNFSLALRNDGRVFGWGDPGNSKTNVPANVTNVVAIAGGNGECIALKADGTLVRWGGAATNIPAGLTNVLEIAHSSSPYYARTASNSFVAWSDGLNPNRYGEAIIPPALTNIITIAAGYVHAIAIGNPIAPQMANFISWNINTNRRFEMTFTGQSNAIYNVWSSTDLTNWSSLGNVTSYQRGVFAITNFSTNTTQEFYRASSPYVSP